MRIETGVGVFSVGVFTVFTVFSVFTVFFTSTSHGGQ